MIGSGDDRESSSSDQALLLSKSKPAPVVQALGRVGVDDVDDDDDDDDGDAPPPPSDENQQYPAVIAYNQGPRRFQDLPFLILFLLFLLSTWGFGIFSVFHRNPNRSQLSSFTFDPITSSCVPDHHHALNSNAPAPAHHFLKNLIWTLLATLLLSVPVLLALLSLLRHFTKHLVYASLPFFLIIPLFFDVYWFVACTLSSTCTHALPLPYRILLLLFILLIIAIFLWIILANWHRIHLTIQILGVASDALARNLALLLLLPCFTLALLIYLLPIVVFLVFARFNGSIVPRTTHDEYTSCVWKQDGWVPAYYALSILTMLWSAAAMLEAQLFVISGTIAQWYFSKEDCAPRRGIRRSLRNAFGPSFGTVCFSGLLICIVRVIRATVDAARREDVATGFVNIILRCCANAFLTAIDFVNKFTINFAAITGDAYCYSAKMTYELLRRNLLSVVFVETVSTRILGGIIFVVSAIYAIAVCAVVKAVSKLGVEAYFVAAIAWALLMVILGLFVHILDNVIDTVYVCFAIDRDKGEVCKQEVHEVYVHLPVTRHRHSYRASPSIRTPLMV